MAESNPWRHWKTRKIPQVIWVIDEIYNNLWRKTINQQRLQKLGDELDAEKLLQMPKPWSVIKMEKNLTTKLIFQMLKDGSKKNFSTREIFMKWLHDRDRQEYGHVRENEIRFVLDNLNKSRTYCDCGWLNHNGMVVQEGLASNIFQPLSLAFGGSPDNMAESICNELSKNKVSLKYKKHDKKDWISKILEKKVSASWDPLVFCVCANLHNCIVSIQANESEEYRIYPDSVSFTTIIKFARVAVSKYVHLKCNREVFDAVNVSGLYICNKSTTCHDCLTMQETMRGQLARISQEQASKNKNLKGEKLVAAHSLAVDRVIDEKEELQESVDSLGKELDQSKKQTGKLVHICSEISNAISVIDALKCQMDEIVNDEKQKQECSDSSEPMKLNNAQVSCNLNPVHVSGQRNTNAQSDIHLPDVEEVYKQNKVKKI